MSLKGGTQSQRGLLGKDYRAGREALGVTTATGSRGTLKALPRATRHLTQQKSELAASGGKPVCLAVKSHLTSGNAD